MIPADAAEIQLSRHIRGRRHGAVPQIHGGRRLAGSKALEPSPGALFRETSASIARRCGSGGGHLTSPDSTTNDMRVRARRQHGADWARGGGSAPRAGAGEGRPRPAPPANDAVIARRPPAPPPDRPAPRRAPRSQRPGASRARHSIIHTLIFTNIIATIFPALTEHRYRRPESSVGHTYNVHSIHTCHVNKLVTFIC